MVAPRPAAERIKNDVNLYPCASPFGEDAAEVCDRLAVACSVAFKRDTLLRVRRGT